MNRYHRLPLVPCPTCISRAPWVPVEDAATLPDDYAWVSHQQEPQTVFFNHTDPRRATFKRTVDPSGDFTRWLFFKRDMRGVGQARKGYQCDGCADREEGTGY